MLSAPEDPARKAETGPQKTALKVDDFEQQFRIFVDEQGLKGEIMDYVIFRNLGPIMSLACTERVANALQGWHAVIAQVHKVHDLSGPPDRRTRP